MLNGIARIPDPVNEPVLNYAPGSPERASLKARLDSMLREAPEIPLIIGGREVRTGKVTEIVCPHDHRHVLGSYHQAGPAEVEAAVTAAGEAWKEWSEMPWEARAAVLLKAADLLAGPWRDTVNAATMLGQSKNAFQAEIDSAAELIDFWRFNPYFLQQLYQDQPRSVRGIWDMVEYRALEGFVFAVTPFNFTSIGGNLPTAPALMGNTVLWKPASTAILSNYYVLKVLEAAGMPPGVINFVPGRGASVGNPVFGSRSFAGLHFTGSTSTFQGMWSTIAGNLAHYGSYPRIVGETGGKDFVFAHPSADVRSLVVALVRGAFEYQGQKCSAASRAYVPRSLWKRVEEDLREEVAAIRMGPPTDFRNFMCAVIDEPTFDKTLDYVRMAKESPKARIVTGGEGDKSTGYYVEPTVVATEDPRFTLMQEEIFAPVLTLYVYDDADLDGALELCDTTSPYALTGAIFAQDRGEIVRMTKRLRHAAGNFYVNDKPTGAVVGQQPFGGGRASGTNDKAGSLWNLVRWVSMHSIKENFVPPTAVPYPHQDAE
ncbi:MAG TPA: L-glutamate gamma-semialdehyde dehydrogenase [Thermoanaerobaculia bacterium]|nr:L-glutamate gamma-semialdehyde dehydrogenase [Thermoanaerobaculia bacterium]